MRKLVRKCLHTGHIGIETTRLRAKETVYWPGIDSEIYDLVINCSACLQYRNKQQKETYSS